MRTLSDHVSRRRFLTNCLVATSALTTPIALWSSNPKLAYASASAGFDFNEIFHGVDGSHHVAAGHDANVLIRWGDAVTADAPVFAAEPWDADAQAKQFGYNNDGIAYFPHPDGSDANRNGLLVVSHQYVRFSLAFPQNSFSEGSVDSGSPLPRRANKQQVDAVTAALGYSVIAVRRGDDGVWTVDNSDTYARRITAAHSVRLSGPAAGSSRVRTAQDPDGLTVAGTRSNTGGTRTPWNTFLGGEGFFNLYFAGVSQRGRKAPEDISNQLRYGISGDALYANAAYYPEQFDLTVNPNEANRFGWAIEIDPYDPQSMPVKRTALGRFKHYGCESVLNSDGRVVVYMTDGDFFETLYKFVSYGRYRENDAAHNRTLLDSGTLFAAQFIEGQQNVGGIGDVRWLPLVWGSGPLTDTNGFYSQADVLIEARRAADFVGATTMDRSKSIRVCPLTNHVYVLYSNNPHRRSDFVDIVNIRARDESGFIIELRPTDGNHGSLVHGWRHVVLCGDISGNDVRGRWSPKTSANGWFVNPNRSRVDSLGRLWVSTDQRHRWTAKTCSADGIWGLTTDEDEFGLGKMFFRAPFGTEVAGIDLTPDASTMFVAIKDVGLYGYPDFDKRDFAKHVGVGEARDPEACRAYFDRRGRPHGTYDTPSTRWPDNGSGLPPRPSVVAITPNGPGKVG